jgi:hypothetical protein
MSYREKMSEKSSLSICFLPSSITEVWFLSDDDNEVSIYLL